MVKEQVKVAKDSYDALPPGKRAQVDVLFQALDTDGDDSVTLTEFEKFVTDEGLFEGSKLSRIRMFELFDKNQDGHLDKNEVTAFFLYLAVGSGEQEKIAKRSRRKVILSRASMALESLLLAFGLGNLIVGVTTEE